MQHMTNSFEARLSVIKHISEMMLEMADVDWDKFTKEEELIMLEDYEEVATHLLDSLQFDVTNIDENGVIHATFTPISPVEYIEKYLAENSES